jgi:hypothetical protein
MFRLAEPSPRLWLGLTFYQLGAVLHDLIMRVPLFEEVVRKSRDNRYLIAHAVATRTPSISPDSDIPLDVLLIAQRALDKDLDRRLKAVKWEDFINDGNERRRYEVLLGLEGDTTIPTASKKRQIQLQKLTESIETILDGRFVEKGIHAKHAMKKIAQGRLQLRYTWSPPTLSAQGTATAIAELRDGGGNLHVDVWAEFIGRGGASVATERFPACTIAMPADPSVPPLLVECAFDALLRAFAEIVGHLHAPAAD